MVLGELLVNLKMNAANFTSALDRASARFEQMSGKMLAGGAALSAGVTAPLAMLGNAAVGMASQLQTAEIGFTTMLGSAERAGSFLEELKDFAARTPFEFPDLVTAAQRMMALGFEAKDVVPTMTAVGNAAAGLGGGADLINRITLALGQMRAKGKVSGEEMRQLAEAGIPAWGILAKAIGKTEAEAMKLAQKGAFTVGEVLPVLIQGINQRFAGLMENFSTTVMGRWSNLKDSLSYILGDIGAALFPLINELLEKLVIPATEALKNLVAWFAKLPDPIKYAAVAVGALAAAIGPLLLAFGGMSMALTSIGTLLGTTGLAATIGALLPILGTAAGAVAAVAAAWGLWQLEPVQNAVKAIGSALSDLWHNTLEPVVDAIGALGSAFLDAAANMVSSGFRDLWDAIKSAVNAVVEAFNSAKSTMTDLWGSISDAVGTVLEPFRGVWDKLVEVIGLVVETIAAIQLASAIGAFEALKAAAEALWGKLTELGDLIGTIVSVAFEALVKQAQALWNVIQPLAEAGFRNFSNNVKNLANAFSAVLSPVLDTIIGALEKLPLRSFAERSTMPRKSSRMRRRNRINWPRRQRMWARRIRTPSPRWTKPAYPSRVWAIPPKRQRFNMRSSRTV